MKTLYTILFFACTLLLLFLTVILLRRIDTGTGTSKILITVAAIIGSILFQVAAVNSYLKTASHGKDS